MKNIFQNKNILISGGVGSIGSVITEKILKEFQPKQVRIFDANEENLFKASLKYEKNRNVRFLIGDIRDKERVNWAARGIDYIFHAAALKHVALNEYNPFEAIKTNILGTQNLLMAAITNKVERFINISSDKAAIPTSTMGAAKLLAERLTTAANHYKGNAPTICLSVRFGNVIASSGSVTPIFTSQIKRGGPITLTDKRMVRYFMTVDQAVNLIFEATHIAQGGEVFILKMPALRIIDLAKVLIEELSPKYGYNSQKIIIKEVGAKPGEKINEELLTPLEKEFCLEMKNMYVIPPLIENPSLKTKAIENKISYYFKLGARKITKTDRPKLLSTLEIKKLLKKAAVLS